MLKNDVQKFTLANISFKNFKCLFNRLFDGSQSKLNIYVQILLIIIEWWLK